MNSCHRQIPPCYDQDLEYMRLSACQSLPFKLQTTTAVCLKQTQLMSHDPFQA
uniref:Uncharacterized protein n=1 Tax=Setaria italica TaxID=4555 RepID=K3Z1W0_SETIT